MDAITPGFGATSTILPANRRVSKFPGREYQEAPRIRFRFEDGCEKAIDQFAWLDEDHIVYIDGSDIIERHGDAFYIIRDESYQAAHDRLHYEIYAALDRREAGAEAE